jgi:hypothetical protein
MKKLKCWKAYGKGRKGKRQSCEEAKEGIKRMVSGL